MKQRPTSRTRLSHTAAFVSVISLLGVLCRAPLAIAAPDDVEQAQPVAEMNMRVFQMDEANFDANVFQPSGNAQKARSQIESKLKLQLDEMIRACDLNEAQILKLKLAASSDIKRYFDEVAVVRNKVKSGNLDQNEWNNIWQEIQPLRTKPTVGLFGDNSFFLKTLRKTLSEEQEAKYDAIVNDRRRFRYRACIEVSLTNLDNQVTLHRSQHEAIVKMLMEETQPPHSFGQYDQYVVMYQLGRLPESKLKSILDQRQWQALQAQMNQYRGMEQFLMQNGLIPKEKPEVKILKARVKRIVMQFGPPADANDPANRPVTALSPAAN